MGEGQAQRITTPLLLVALALALASSAAGAVPCEPWEGEPAPLPRVDDADELRARWAALRIRELSAAAAQAEARAPGRAHGLWQRVLCLDPESAAAIEGIRRTPLVAVHRPTLVNRLAPEEPDDPIAALSHPLQLWRPARPYAIALDEAEEHLRAARFEESLARVTVARIALRERRDPKRAAKLEVVGATAALALGRTAEAEASLSRALDADPALALDPANTPPKVQRALERVRAERSAP